MKTFYWHDYETWGANPMVDRPSQFAGVRTDENLNIIGDPLVLYCKPPVDIWPNPEACLVTGITPQQAEREGLSEPEFIAKVHHEFVQPHTCGVGYNSIRFDDEVTRFTLYRNFYDPYEREWRNGNSRWDIIDMIRLTYAVRPEGIEWPMVDGKPSFKLELLTQANGISHQSAHDAYSDVAATIEMAKLIRTRKPDLYNYVVKYKAKRVVSGLIDFKNRKPLLHISSRFSSERGCAGLVVPLAMHPTNSNAVIVYDLSVDPSPLVTLSAEEIRSRVFVSNDDLPEGVDRLPLKLIHLNKCPILATPKLVDEHMQKRIGLDKSLCERHWQKIKTMDIEAKLKAMYQLESFPPKKDVEQKLYDGFLNDADKALATTLRSTDLAGLAEQNFVFNDARLNQMVPLYKGRHGYSFLSENEQQGWNEYVGRSLLEGGEGKLSYSEVVERIKLLQSDVDMTPEHLAILAECAAYVDTQAKKYIEVN